MGQSITAACHYYNEVHALGGWLESASQWADHILLYETGPGGEHSTDGSLELAQKWGVDLQFGSIDEGFGVVRTKIISLAPTDWIWIGDADERIFRFAPRMICHGTDSYDVGKHYPALADVNLSIQITGVYDQIAVLRSLMRPEFDAIVTSRRHWQDFSLTRPSQSWQIIADWQARILRCAPHVGYDPRKAMHEALVDFRTWNSVTETYQCPKWYQPTHENCEVFFDHFHLPVKRLEPEQRAHDIAIYNRINEHQKPPTLAEFKAKQDQRWMEPDGNCA